MSASYGNGHGFDWPSLIREKRELQGRQRNRDIARAQRRQAEREKADRLRRECAEIVSTSLGGEPVDLAQLAVNGKRIRGSRYSSRGGWR